MCEGGCMCVYACMHKQVKQVGRSLKKIEIKTNRHMIKLRTESSSKIKAKCFWTYKITASLNIKNSYLGKIKKSSLI